MFNRVMIIGRLGQDPQLKYSQSGSPITTFSVATDESFIDRDGTRQQRTEWFRVVAFQKIAENCSRYLHKGSLVYVEGSLQTRKWQDQQGNERTMVEVRAQRVSFLDRRQPQDEFQRSEGQGGMGENDYGQRSSYSENRYSRYESYQNDSEPSSSPYGAPGQRYERQPHGLSDEQFEPAEDGGSESALDKVPF
ncbi:MAG: single-stranded DNA-binding protein [Desulfovibrio sp.]|nr:single-stranded DNA-binding protein [Desulfovibrio sp.]